MLNGIAENPLLGDAVFLQLADGAKARRIQTPVQPCAPDRRSRQPRGRAPPDLVVNQVEPPPRAIRSGQAFPDKNGRRTLFRNGRYDGIINAADCIPVTGPVYSAEVRKRALALRDDGKNAVEVAKIIGNGLNFTTVRNWFRSHDNGLTIQTQRGSKSFDHTGITYGELTVIKLIGRVPQYGRKKDSGETIPLWELRCSCGTTVHQTGTVLNQYKQKKRLIEAGEGKSSWHIDCRENPIHVMPCKIGDALGDLEVLGFPPNEGQCGKATVDRWLISCSCKACGRFNTANPYLLTISEWRARLKRLQENPGSPCACGCTRSVKHGMSRPQEDGRTEELEYTLWNGAKQRAKKQRVPFDLDPLYMKEIGIPAICPVLGIPINKSPGDGSGERSDNSPSLDKFIPSLGYVKGNVHVISWRANRIKNDGTPEEWRKIAEWCQREDVKRKMSSNGD